MTKLITDKVGVRPVTHRAGRWTTNDDYFSLLVKYGYKVDCSVTPGMDWSINKGQGVNSKGSDYSLAENHPYYVKEGLLEVPVTVKKLINFFFHIVLLLKIL